MNEHRAIMDQLVAGLNRAGLECVLEDDGGTVSVAPSNRGARASVAIIDLPPDDLAEYLGHLSSGAVGRSSSREDAVGFLFTQLVESLTAVHDGDDSNLTTRVFLRRSGPQQYLGLDESRTQHKGTSYGGPDPLAWTSDRF